MAPSPFKATKTNPKNYNTNQVSDTDLESMDVALDQLEKKAKALKMIEEKKFYSHKTNERTNQHNGASQRQLKKTVREAKQLNFIPSSQVLP